jgi:hypothetical protein
MKVYVPDQIRMMFRYLREIKMIMAHDILFSTLSMMVIKQHCHVSVHNANFHETKSDPRETI